jgi:histidinol dehydrogenase
MKTLLLSLLILTLGFSACTWSETFSNVTKEGSEAINNITNEFNEVKGNVENTLTEINEAYTSSQAAFESVKTAVDEIQDITGSDGSINEEAFEDEEAVTRGSSFQ